MRARPEAELMKYGAPPAGAHRLRFRRQRRGKGHGDSVGEELLAPEWATEGGTSARAKASVVNQKCRWSKKKGYGGGEREGTGKRIPTAMGPTGQGRRRRRGGGCGCVSEREVAYGNFGS